MYFEYLFKENVSYIFLLNYDRLICYYDTIIILSVSFTMYNFRISNKQYVDLSLMLIFGMDI